jgi:hypothetical protein
LKFGKPVTISLDRGPKMSSRHFLDTEIAADGKRILDG